MARDHFAVDPCSCHIPDRVPRSRQSNLPRLRFARHRPAPDLYRQPVFLDWPYPRPRGGFIPGKPRRAWLAIIAGLVYLFFFTYSLPGIESTSAHIFRAADYRLHSVLIEAAYRWWFVGSQVAFLLVFAFGTADRAAHATAWLYGKAREAMRDHGAALRPGAIALDPPSSARRHFLEQTAVLVSATGFAAAGYGLLYGRQNVEIVRQRIRLARLPKAFEGFRIAQLSDVHIGPFPERRRRSRDDSLSDVRLCGQRRV